MSVKIATSREFFLIEALAVFIVKSVMTGIAHSSTLNIEAIGSSEKLVNFHRTTQGHII
jgi:hypothetical protein